jgi:hypothetical protein
MRDEPTAGDVVVDVSRLGRTTRGWARAAGSPIGSPRSGRGPIGSRMVTLTTTHEIQLRPVGAISLTSHDVLVDFVVASERIIDCRHGR